MAEANELKQFLSKRGYDVEVDKPDGQTFIVSLHCRTVDEIKTLLASIEEPGRFVISVQFSDIKNLLLEDSGIPEAINIFRSNLEDVRKEMAGNVKKLQETDTQLKKDSELSIGGLWDKIEELKRELNERLAKLEKTPWWKKW